MRLSHRIKRVTLASGAFVENNKAFDQRAGYLKVISQAEVRRVAVLGLLNVLLGTKYLVPIELDKSTGVCSNAP